MTASCVRDFSLGGFFEVDPENNGNILQTKYYLTPLCGTSSYFLIAGCRLGIKSHRERERVHVVLAHCHEASTYWWRICRRRAMVVPRFQLVYAARKLSEKLERGREIGWSSVADGPAAGSRLSTNSKNGSWCLPGISMPSVPNTSRGRSGLASLISGIQLTFFGKSSRSDFLAGEIHIREFTLVLPIVGV